MPEVEFDRLAALLRGGRYADLASALEGAETALLAAGWQGLSPLEKLVFFKLMQGPRAMDLYARLPFKEKYFLLCGFPLQAIAPVLETLSPSERRLFVSLPRECYDRMFRQVVSPRVEFDFTVRKN